MMTTSNIKKHSSVSGLCRRFLPVACLFFAFNSTLPAADSSDGVEAARARAKWRMATVAAAREIDDKLQKQNLLTTNNIVLIQQQLADAMGANIEAHARRGKSRRICAAAARDFYLRNAADKLTLIATRASATSPLPIGTNDIIEIIGGNWRKNLNKSADDFIKEQYPAIFTAARRAAVALAREKLVATLRLPPADDLNREMLALTEGRTPIQPLNSTDFSKLRSWVQKQTLPSDKSVFEEIHDLVAEQSRLITRKIQQQYTLQRNAIQQAAKKIPATSRTAATIQQHLTRAVTDAINNAKKQSNANASQIYETFDIVNTNITALAEQLEQTQLANFVRQSDFSDINSKNIYRQINRDLKTHLGKSKSRATFFSGYWQKHRADISAKYARGSQPSPEANYFQEKLVEGQPAGKALQESINTRLEKELPPARKQIADEQIDKYYLEIRDTAQPLAPPALTMLSSDEKFKISNAESAIKFLRAGGYQSLPDPASLPLLDETRDKITDFGRREAKLAHTAIKTQLKLLRKLEKEQDANLRQEVAEGRPLNDIRQAWREKLLQMWQAQATANKSPYTDLTPVAQSELEKTIRQHYDSIKQQQAQQPSEISKPVDESGTISKSVSREIRQDPSQTEEIEKQQPDKDHAPKPSPDDIKADALAAKVLSKAKASHLNQPDAILLLHDIDSDTSRATLLLTEQSQTFSTVFEPDNPQKAAETIFTAIKPQLTSLLNSNATAWKKGQHRFLIFKSRKTPRLKMFVVIESNDVRHRTSLFLREKIEEEIKDWTSGQKDMPTVSLDWKVGLQYTPADSEKPAP